MPILAGIFALIMGIGYGYNAAPHKVEIVTITEHSDGSRTEEVREGKGDRPGLVDAIFAAGPDEGR